MDLYESWLGIGVKGGGTLALVGAETLFGEVTNLGFVQDRHTITISSIRVGAGLGGGAGFVVIIVYNCANLMNLDGTEATDWSINIALGAKWDAVAKVLAKKQFFMTLIKLGNKFAKATPGDLDNLRNSMSYLYTCYGIASMKGPTVVTLDIPFAGVGAELSVHYLDGEISIGKLTRGGKTYGG